MRPQNRINAPADDRGAPADDKQISSPQDNFSVPVIELPKGGGAIKGIEEKFQVNAVNGTLAFTIPIPLSSSRHGNIPSLALNYDSGNGNSPFGIGWNVDVPSIRRKTENGLPQYRDAEESDTFILSSAEDLVPLLEKQGDNFTKDVKKKIESGITYTVTRYRPRIEGLFARIERWKNDATDDTHWRTIAKNNRHLYYGLTEESRVVDPNNSARIFQWLLCRTHDDKGNIAIYRYKKEDFAEVPRTLSERNRINQCTRVYLKTVLYGNKQPYYLGDAVPAEDDFLFKVIFDYGEHDATTPIVKDIDVAKHPWKCRQDPFSSYRAGFEIRTYRRCSRIMLFHCFDAPDLPHKPYLVSSLELIYQDALALIGTNRNVGGFSYLVKARQWGHKWEAASNSYSSKHLPDFDLSYQQHEWNTRIQEVSPEDAINAPIGVDDKQYLWIDLFSEGISGILTEQAGGWFYKSNLGNGSFSAAKLVAPKPSFSGLTSGAVSIQELEGNGIKYLVQYATEPRGFFKLTADDEWAPFRNFSSLPNLNFRDPNMRPIDLNGDGRAELLVTEDDVFRWYPGAGEKGFEVSQAVTRAIDEEKGPAIIFADQTQSIFLADISGDGLTDILRVRNGEICYWPNLGYGRFGAKVSMENAPLFDHPDKFNPRYLRLADIDGSGTIDVIYLGQNEFRIWLNLNGNRWTQEPEIIPAFPEMDNLADVSVLDFLGSGTACIVYSSPLPQHARQPLQYIDLMGSKKPHLLMGFQNNCGKEVSLEFKSSAHFYLEDKKQGKHWITKLHFPVHCVSRVRTEDKVRETVFSNTYRYSHGYFDHNEKEFRGFAKVEQIDTEDFRHFKLNNARNVVEEDLHQPPVRTVSWFHTGAFLGNDRILHQCEAEYFQNESFQEYEIPEPLISDDLTAEELREALRACKGLALRTEVYANDESPLSDKPYSAAQTTCEIRRVQPKLDNKYACFLVLPSESISYSYERNPADPRVSHSFVLESDELGNVTKSASVVYPRVSRPLAPNEIPDTVWETQNKLHIVYGEAQFTEDILSDAVYRLRVGYESTAYEISGVAVPAALFLKKQELLDQIRAAAIISFDEEFAGGLQKRLSNHRRRYFFKDDLSDALPLGHLSSLGIVHRSYQLAFTRQLVSKYYDTKVDSLMMSDAKFVHSEGDDDWWAPTGIAIYDPNPRNNFYTPIGARDIFGNESFVEYDKYVLLVTSATDSILNTVTAANDYRTLAPSLITDPNLNRAAVETDEFGFVIKSAVMGKEGAAEGDTLADPTARMEYDLFNWSTNQKPNYVHMFVREQHGLSNPRWQESYAYSDGGGKVIMTKAQAEPGKAKVWNSVTRQVDEVDADQRWVGNGRTILNNKGNRVKQYEPYFSTTLDYEDEDNLVETGFTAVNYYDPPGRNIRTEFPNGTFTKIQFDTWHLKSFDPNDTVKDSPWYADRGSPDPAIIPEPTSPEQRSAWLAAKHDNTPSLFYLDSIGRPFFSVADHGSNRSTSVLFESDPLGRYARSFDQMGREVSFGVTNLLGAPIYSKTAEKGEKWLLQDAIGRLYRSWNSLNREFRCVYDKLHRPVSYFVRQGPDETLYGYSVYGDLLPGAAQQNMKGQLYQLFDQSGSTTVRRVDFKGNVLAVERRLARNYDQLINWNVFADLNSIEAIAAAAAPMLETEIFTFTTTVDALNRPTLTTLADNSVVEPKYNEANLLDSLRVKIRGEGDFITFLENQDYDAKGQRQFAQYGNGLITNYSYDPKTFRLINVLTKKTGSNDAQSLQNLSYTFDPRGNIVYSTDDAQQTNYFSNAVVRAESKFEYDAIYQLVRATGREHAGLGGNAPRDNNDLPYVAQLPHHNDLNAVRQYTEVYRYDDCGNFLTLQHIAAGASWTQRYHYESQDDAGNKTNRLKSTSLPGDADLGPYSATYQHDLHGNITRMPHLDELIWNFMDQLAKVNLGGGGFAFFVYGFGGSRIRKVVRRLNGKRIERIYLGLVEIYREYQNGKKLERSTLHVADNVGRIAQIDTKLLDEDGVDAANPLNTNLIRYQYGNHLGSATMETDGQGTVISYEEYHPYGTSAYRSAKSDVDLSLKRYRFSGKEHDDETALYYFGVRYYAAWLGRWTSADPAGFVDGFNQYRYCGDNPVVFSDPNGTDRVYALGPQFQRDIHTNTPEARARLEAALTGREVEDNGVTYRIDRPALEWRGGRTGWFFSAPQSDISVVSPSTEITFEDEVVTARTPSTGEGSASTNSGAAGGVPNGSPTGRPGGSPAGSPSGSPTGTPGGTGTGTGTGAGGAPQERSFWNRGGSTLLLGLALLGAGLLTILTAGAATPLLVLAAGAMATAGGIAVTTTSAIQLGASYSGATTAQQDREMTGVLQTVGSLSSPLGLTGGAIGTVVADNPEQGLSTGAFVGNVAELGVGGVRFGMASWSRGATVPLTSNAPEIVGLANRMSSSVAGAGGTMAVAAHGAPGLVQTASGAVVPISELAPIIQSAPQGRVVILACQVGQDAQAVQALANTTGRSVTAFSSNISTWNTTLGRMLLRPVSAGVPATSITRVPQYLSPYLSLTPNIAAPGAAAASGLARQVDN